MGHCAGRAAETWAEQISGLFGKALGAADAVADAETGAMLLLPFGARVERLLGGAAAART